VRTARDRGKVPLNALLERFRLRRVRSSEREGGTGPERFSSEMSMERMKLLEESQETPVQLVQRSVELLQLDSEPDGSDRRDLAVSKAASSDLRVAALTTTERTEARRRKGVKTERIVFLNSSSSFFFYRILRENFVSLSLGREKDRVN
jgi:hypothetical protein